MLAPFLINFAGWLLTVHPIFIEMISRHSEGVKVIFIVLAYNCEIYNFWSVSQGAK
jgi:hypothetical protein